MSNFINSFWGGGNYLLDTYSAEVGWSFRRLKSTATYSCEIERSNDNATTNVLLHDTDSLTLSSTVSAGGTLGDWVGVNSARVRTIYDQTGNGYDYNETTHANQPIIINAGVVSTSNGKADMRTQAGDNLTGSTITLTDFSVYTVYEPQGLAGAVSCILGGTPAGLEFSLGGVFAGLTNLYVRNATQLRQGASTPTGQNLVEFYNDYIYLNNSEDTPYEDSDSMTGISLTTLGSRGDGTQPFNGYVQEIIIFSSDQHSNRSSIVSEINGFYSVY